MDSPDEIDRFFASQNWSSNTTDRYHRALLIFLGEMKHPSELDAVGLRRWLGSHPWGNSAQWIALNAVKAWLRWKYGATHPALALKLRREESAPQRTLKMPQVRDLLDIFDTSRVKGRRDLAMCTLFLDTGLRVAEICSLDQRYVDIEERSLRVVVKGGQWEFAVYSPYTASCLANWVAVREGVARAGVKAFFVGVGGKKPGERMTRHGLQRVVKEWGERAGIGQLSPHDFRRTFATQATRAGAPQRVAMAAGRWKDERVFRRYTSAIEPADIEPYSPVMAAIGGS